MRRLAFALLLLAVAAALAAGPKKGDKPPPLHIDAVNDNRGAYELVADTGQYPCFVFLVLKPDDKKSYDLANQLDKQVYKRHREKAHLHGAFVLPGDNKLREQVAKLCQDNEVTTPAAVVDPKLKDLEAWQLGTNLTNMLVLIKKGKVLDVLTNVSEDDKVKLLRAFAALLAD